MADPIASRIELLFERLFNHVYAFTGTIEIAPARNCTIEGYFFLVPAGDSNPVGP